MTSLAEDCWTASFVPAALGRYKYTVAAWIDAFATWRQKLARPTERDDIELALREGALLMRAAESRARGAERGALLAYAGTLDGEAPLTERRQMASAPDRSHQTVYDPPLEAVVERPLARFSAWYEFFPRSAGDGSRPHGTLAMAARRLKYVADMGFDVVHLPRDFVARLKTIRRGNAALQSDERLQFRPIDNDQLVCYSKHSADGANVILVVVNLDPLHAQSGFIDMPLEEWALDASAPYQADELLSGARYEWQGRRVFVTLTPSECPAWIYRIHARRSVSERDFDYFA